MSKQWMLVGGIVLAIGTGAFVLTRTDEAGVVGVDTPAPDFRAIALPAKDSVQFRARYEGQVTLVNIWATWCAPCRDEMPSIEALYKDYAPKGLKIAAVSIDTDDPSKVLDFVHQYGLTFDILQDQSGAIQGLYQTTGVPESFLLDRHGRIVRRLIGGHDWNSAINRELIDRLLAEGS